MIGTPITKNGMNSGAKKKKTWPDDLDAGLAAHEHRGRRHEAAEHAARRRRP